MTDKKDDPREVDRAPKLEMANIYHEGGVIRGPVLFQVDDSIEETIESLVVEFDLPGAEEDYNLYVTNSDYEMITLNKNFPVEDYYDLLQSYSRIELSTRPPPAPTQPNLSVDVKVTAGQC